MNEKVRFIKGVYVFGAAALIGLFCAPMLAQQTKEEKDKAAIRALIDKINLAWQLERPSTLFQEIISDKGFVFAMPKPDNPSEALVVHKQRFCELLDSIMQGQRPQKHEHKIESITIIGPLAYEMGTALQVTADGTQRYDEVMNIFAKDETGWKLIHSTPTANIRKALSSSPNDTSKTEKLTTEQTRKLQENIRGTFSGIGVEIDTQSDGILVKRIIAGGPADNAGLNAEEIITAIDGESTRGMSLEKAVSLIKGLKGTSVKLKVTSKDGTSRQVNVIRGTVVVSGVESRILESNIGLLAISGFNKQTPSEVRQAIRHFRQNKVRGLVLDLRGNYEGFYPALYEIASIFVGRDKPMWQIQYINQRRPTIVRGNLPKIVQWPVVVLVSSKTSGGGELLACALRTDARAKLIGQTTAGKGFSRSWKKQADGTSEKSISAYLLTADGQPINNRGIRPDLWIDSKTSPEDRLKQAVDELMKKM